MIIMKDYFDLPNEPDKKQDPKIVRLIRKMVDEAYKNQHRAERRAAGFEDRTA